MVSRAHLMKSRWIDYLAMGALGLGSLYVLTAPLLLPKAVRGHAACFYAPLVYSVTQDWPGRPVVGWYFYDVCGMKIHLPEVRRYGIRVLNQSTNDLNLLNISWDGSAVAFPAVASAAASYSDCYGCADRDVTLYPRARMPTKDVLISYLVPGAPTVTNSLRVELAEDILKAVQKSHGNFMFVVNADGTITSTRSAEP
jgi:hypothetical protein